MRAVFPHLAFIFRTIVGAAMLSGTSYGQEAAPKFAAEELDLFEKKIRPVLVEYCFQCHSATGEKIKGGLVLDTRAAMLKGGESGPGVLPGQPEKSLIIEAIRYADEDLQMPPKHRLTPEQVGDFERWVKMGAPDPRDGAAYATQTIDFAKAKEFWSLRPVVDPQPPEVKDAAWAVTPIDRFILAGLEAKGFRPNPEADRRALFRRATYDLTGLPPTPEEMDAFLNDQSPEAWASAIERLLASPRYGERWGRHWLDVVRYADTSGCNSDYPVPSARLYRDYVINSFSRDKPYDLFLKEQVAGDLLPAANEEQKHERIIATGYLAISRRFGSRAEEFHLTLEDTIDNLGKAALGLSLACARCHDHKFDPVSARDYYALYGIFKSSIFAFPGTEIYRHTKDFVPLAPKEEAEIFIREAHELSALDNKVEKLKEEKKRLKRKEEQAAKDATAGNTKPADTAETGAATPPPPPPERTAADADRELEEAKARISVLEKRQERLPKAFAVFEGKPENARIHRKGEPRNLGDEAPRGFLTVLGGQRLPEGETGSGRAQLAEWVADAKNPLTARVMVNRIWQHHFGRGLVRSPNDFGIRGEAPTHPELLDYLASRFIESGWSIKAMHRLIMASRAYRMSSEDNPQQSLADVNNSALWRFERRRLSAEEIRDSMLAIGGVLDLSPPERHPFPPEGDWKYTQHQPFVADYSSNRRSVYLMQQRIRKQPFLEIFDGADTNASTAARPLSTTPIQALFLMNNPFVHDMAGKTAARLALNGDAIPQQVDLAYRLALSRPASSEEKAEATEYIGQMVETLRKESAEEPERKALASFARVLMSSNEFLHVD